MTDVDAILTGARLPEETVRVCTRGDLLDRLRRLEQEAMQTRVRQAADPRLAGSTLTTEIEDLRAQIEAATVEFRLRALPRRRWQELVVEHPPRKVNGKIHPDDAAGVNNETFFPALIRACTVEPTLREETWQALLDPDSELLNEQQYLRLARTAWDLNKQEPDLPFWSAAWLATRTSGSEFDLPASSASLSDGSTGGRRAK